jgi:hypothetical protein
MWLAGCHRSVAEDQPRLRIGSSGKRIGLPQEASFRDVRVCQFELERAAGTNCTSRSCWRRETIRQEIRASPRREKINSNSSGMLTSFHTFIFAPKAQIAWT